MGIGSHGCGGQEVHDLPPASWTTREVGGVAQPELKGLRARVVPLV